MKNIVNILGAQINIKTGALVENTNKIKEIINGFRIHNNDFIIFPEMTISGYNCGDLFEKEEFINDCNKKLNEIVEETIDLNAVVIVGCPRKESDKLYNSAFIIYKGEIIGHYDKQLLANDYHHEDRKYFSAGKFSKTFYLKGIKFGVIICEDGWKSYGRDIVKEMKNEGAELIFSINYSYFTFNKIKSREEVFANDPLPIVYVNNIGVGDITKNFITYDGNSFTYNPYMKDKFTYPINPSFNNNLFDITFNPKGNILQIMNGVEQDVKTNKYDVISKAITYSIREIFSQCGIKKAQVHISGGIDSAVVAYFAVEAVGKENCVFITQPSKNNGPETLGNAIDLCNALGVKSFQ